MKINRCSVEFLKKFHWVENPANLYEANKELFGDYDEYMKSILEEYNSDDTDEY